LLRDVFVGDFCAALPLFLVFPATTDALVWKSVAAWLGSGLAGLFFVLCWGFASTRDTTGEARRYYRSIFLMEAVAVLAMTGLGCGFARLGFPSTSALPVAVAVYVALCAYVYFRPAPTEVQLPA
jgi:hypothetical protein